jgi:transcriptional regulator with XRE-family HTH domain
MTLHTVDLWYLSPQWGRYKNSGRVVSERIKEIRELRGISRAELAERIGVRTENIRNWENGGTPKDPVLVDEMARALGVATEFLFGEIDDPGNYEGQRELVKLPVMPGKVFTTIQETL